MKCHVQFQFSPIQFKFCHIVRSSCSRSRSFPLLHLSTWAHCSCDICCHKGLSVVTAFCRFVSFPPLLHFLVPPCYSTRSFDISISISSLQFLLRCTACVCVGTRGELALCGQSTFIMAFGFSGIQVGAA